MCYVLKKCPQNGHFLTPTLTRKIENNQKTKTDVLNYNVSSIQIHLIWFSSFSIFGVFSGNQSPIKIFKGQ